MHGEAHERTREPFYGSLVLLFDFYNFFVVKIL